MEDNDPWPEWIRQHEKQLAERSYGHELRFVEQVLRRVPEIQPSWVTHEFPFQDASGRNRRVDFVLEHWSLHRPIAIEVDGRNKTGALPTKSEHDDFFERQNALTALDFRLLRFTNAQVAQNPVKLRREITEAITLEQLAAQRLRATQQAAESQETTRERGGDYQSSRPAPPPRELPPPVQLWPPAPPTQPAPPAPPGPPAHLPPPSAAPPLTNGGGRSDQQPGVIAPTSDLRGSKHARSWKPIGIGVLVAFVAVFAMMAVINDPAPSPTTAAEELGIEPSEPFSCPSSAPVKGNESSGSGELIYHLPDGQFYDRTNPVRCFATEAEAQRAGFRASQR